MNLEKIEKYIEAQQNRVCYAGPIENGKDFVSGWGIILSKDAVGILIRHYDEFNVGLFDDELIGKIMTANGINPVSIPFKELVSSEEAAKMSPEDLDRFPLYRMKSVQKGKRIDDEVMRVLHQRLKVVSQ
jgi:hypothetical protein